MKLQGTTANYEVGALVAENERFDIYFCTREGESSKTYLLVVAADDQNPIVDRWAFMLRELAQHAERLEAEYAAVKTDPKVFLNYQLGFPKLVETFKSPKGRQVMILAFENSEPSAMVPIARMVHRDRLRVDIKTSVWMMGKALKLLTFAHSLGISVGTIDSGTITIDPRQHYLVFFDWSTATIPASLDDETKRKELSDAALVIIEALEGDVDKHTIPNNEGEEGERYNAHLWTLVDGMFSNAHRAHEHYYALVEKLWPRKFYPFTTFSRTGE